MPWWYSVIEARHELQNPTSEDKLRLMGNLLGLGPDSRVLDVGSGKAGPAILLAREFGWQLTCVEQAEEFVGVARARVEAGGVADRIELVHADAADFSFEPCAYDAALCLGATFALGGLDGTLRTLAPAVRERGFVVVGEPYWRTWPLPAGFEPDEGWNCLSLPETVERIEAAGLAVVSLLDASRDDWDRYETLHWLALDDWLAANPEDPQTEEFRERGPAQPRALPQLDARAARVGDLRLPEMTFEGARALRGGSAHRR
jgi:SAM-dependent methyltransferase